MSKALTLLAITLVTEKLCQAPGSQYLRRARSRVTQLTAFRASPKLGVYPRSRDK